jgi:hypothetical protein
VILAIQSSRLLFSLVMGLLLSIWYLRGIADAIKADIRYFSAAYHSSPVLAVTFQRSD